MLRDALRRLKDRLAKWFKHSATIVVARLSILGGLLLESVSLLADSYVYAGLTQIVPDRWLPWYMVFIGIVTEVARRRTLRE